MNVIIREPEIIILYEFFPILKNELFSNDIYSKKCVEITAPFLVDRVTSDVKFQKQLVKITTVAESGHLSNGRMGEAQGWSCKL